MDPISTFKRTGRKINLSWQIVAESETEAIQNLGRISTLVKMLYPSYSSVEGQLSSTTHIAGAPLMRIRFMNLIQNSANGEELLGYVGGFNNTPILDSGFIEVGPGRIYPKAYDMSCTFTVLHTHRVGWYGSPDERHFGENNDQSVNYPYSAPDPGYNELRERPSQPTEINERNDAPAETSDLTGGYSGLSPEGGAFSGLSEPSAEDLMSMPTDDFPESLPSESSEKNQAADQAEILMSFDSEYPMSGG